MSALIGILGACILIVIGMLMKGGSIGGIINPPAFIMVMGATLGCMIASSGMKSMGDMFRLSLGPGTKDPIDERPETIRSLVEFAEKARREGLLALEDDARQVDDPFLQKGVRLIVDGTDPELVKDILETEMEESEARHHEGQGIFRNGGGFAPTIGILATVLSLVSVLQHLDQPETLGPKISAAFLATFYGVGVANVFFYPMANHLKRHTDLEVAKRTLIIEGVLSIQSGDNPRVLAEKLWSFLPPEMRDGDERSSESVSERAAA